MEIFLEERLPSFLGLTVVRTVRHSGIGILVNWLIVVLISYLVKNFMVQILLKFCHIIPSTSTKLEQFLN